MLWCCLCTFQHISSFGYVLLDNARAGIICFHNIVYIAIGDTASFIQGVIQKYLRILNHFISLPSKIINQLPYLCPTLMTAIFQKKKYRLKSDMKASGVNKSINE